MTDNLRESLSALMDDEANELEVRRILNAIETDDDVRTTWSRYQVARSALKRQFDGYQGFDISGSVALAIADESFEVETPEASGSRWAAVAKPLTSIAVAASVAFAVVLGALQFNQINGVPDAQIAQESEPQIENNLFSGNFNNSFDNSFETPAINVSVEELTPVQKRLREMMRNHAQQSDAARSLGVMPYGQLVNMDQ